MRRWGWVISGFYAVLLLTLFGPAVVLLSGGATADLETDFPPFTRDWFVLTSLSLLVIGQALLLFITVDASSRRLKPRQHVWWSAAVVGFFAALLTFALISCIWAGVAGEAVVQHQLAPFTESPNPSLWLFGLWAFWGAVFYAYYRDSSARIGSAVSWLLAASVLELLVAVPAHVIVRRRDECSAPVVTGFGIATGIAVMFACFGPGVLALYKKRLDRYRAAREASL